MTNTLYLPRRHRRPLLFPPGLLALAWLLWLGCVALPRIPVKFDFIFALFPPAPLQAGLYTNRVDPALTTADINRAALPIMFVSLTPWDDYFFSRQLDFALPDNSFDRPFKGVEYQFPLTPKVEDIDRAISLLQRRSDTFFWLDTRTAPVKIYVYREPAISRVECRGVGPMDVLGWEQALQENDCFHEPTIYEAFFHPDWRTSTLLLLLLTAISAFRLYRQHRPSQKLGRNLSSTKAVE